MNKTVLKLKRRLFSTSQEQIEDYVAAIRDLADRGDIRLRNEDDD